MRKLLPTPPRIGEQTQHKHQALRKGKSPQSLPSRLANYGGLGEPESSKHFCAEITVFASLCSVIFGKRGPASDCLTFFSYLARFLFENAEMPHFRAAFLLCIFFINTIWSEWGDSNSRHLAPKASALPTALHPDMKFSNCGQTCGQRRFLTSYRRGGKCCQPNCPKAFRVFQGLRPEPGPHAPKASALPTALHPVMKFSNCGQTCGHGRFLTTSFAKILSASASVSARCGPRLFPSWMRPARSQSKRATNCATPGYGIVLSVVLHVVLAIF